MIVDIPKGMKKELEKLCEATPEKVWISRAPGRVEIIGNHTDYNGGVVLAATIDKFVWILAAQSDEVEIHSMNYNESVSFSPDQISISDGNDWHKYARGVYAP